MPLTETKPKQLSKEVSSPMSRRKQLLMQARTLGSPEANEGKGNIGSTFLTQVNNTMNENQAVTDHIHRLAE